MAAMKDMLNQDKLDEMEYDTTQDKICESMYCTQCGNSPKIWPIWSGKENWYAGECDTCDEYAEFYLEPNHPDPDVPMEAK